MEYGLYNNEKKILIIFFSFVAERRSSGVFQRWLYRRGTATVRAPYGCLTGALHFYFTRAGHA